MKKIFMLLVACVAMVFVSCSKDDDGDNSTPLGGKQVKSITWKNIDNGKTEITTFEYDNKNRIIKETWDGYVSSYSYKDNELIETNEDGTYHYTLKNGLVVSDDDGDTYEYDNDKQLVKINSGDYNKRYTWQNGNVIKYSSGSTEINYTYTSYEDKLNLDFYSDYMLPEYWYLGCYGKGNKNLVQTINAYGSLYSFEYKFTDDGYVTEVKMYKTRTGETKRLYSTHTVEYK